MSKDWTCRFIIWTNYGLEGWKPDGADTWEDAVRVWKEQMSHGNFEVLITEYVPVAVLDNRESRGCWVEGRLEVGGSIEAS